MVFILKKMHHFGSLIFAIGFLAPLTAQLVTAMGWTPPFGLSPIVFGLLIALALGLPANLRGRWF